MRRRPPSRRPNLRPRLAARAAAGATAIALALAGLGLTTGTAGAAPDPTPSVSESPTTPASKPSLSLSVETITPSVLTPKTDLVVTGTLHNTTDSTISNPKVHLRIARDLMRTRSAVADWDSDSAATVGSVVGSADLGDSIDPGQTLDFTITVPAGESNLYPASAWGPRRISVESSGSKLGVSDRVRSFVVWCPDASDVTPMSLSILAPLVAPAADPTTGLPDADALASQTAVGGRLSTILSQTSKLGVSYAVDPALLPSAPTPSSVATSVGPTATSDPSPSSTASAGKSSGSASSISPSWSAALRVASATNELFQLPYADTDLSAIAHSDQPSILSDATGLASKIASATPDVPMRGGLAFPAEGLADSSTVNLVAQQGFSTIVLADPAVSNGSISQLTYSPTGRAEVSVAQASGVRTDPGGQGFGTLPAVVSDDVLTQLVSGPTTNSALRTQRILAETALISLEQPSTPRSLLALTPRDWTPNGALLGALDAALTDIPWLTVAPLSSLIAQPASEGLTVEPAKDLDRADEVSPKTLDGLTAAQDALANFAGTLAQPSDLIDKFTPRITAVAGLQGRKNPEDRAASAETILADISKVTSSIEVPSTSKLRAVAETISVPVTVTNNFSENVTVQVKLHPRTPQVSVKDPEPVTIAPGATKRVEVEVTALGNGETAVDVALLNPAGQVILHADPLQLQINADWEDLLVTTSAVLLVVLLVFGLWRSIRKSRRRRAGLDPAAATELPESLGSEASTDAPADIESGDRS